MKQLDIGVGGANRIESGYDGYGADIFAHERPWLIENKTADLTFQPIPYESDTFDLVTAYDVMEHIPKVVYIPEMETGELAAMRSRNSLIELFNEVYRVLKDGGEFYFVVPKGGTTQYMGDPTHVTEWVEDSVNYYSGDYFGHHDAYGHTSKFKKVSVDVDPQLSWRMSIRLKAIKPNEEPYDV